MLAESANRTKKGGQELIGGLDVRVNRNHFGRQTESFQAQLDLPFLGDTPFPVVFIRAPIVECILPHQEGVQVGEEDRDDTVVAPSRQAKDAAAKAATAEHVEVLATLSKTAAQIATQGRDVNPDEEKGDVVAVRQGNVFATSFHPELTGDSRIHAWWLRQVQAAAKQRTQLG